MDSRQQAEGQKGHRNSDKRSGDQKVDATPCRDFRKRESGLDAVFPWRKRVVISTSPAVNKAIGGLRDLKCEMRRDQNHHEADEPEDTEVKPPQTKPRAALWSTFRNLQPGISPRPRPCRAPPASDRHVHEGHPIYLD